MITDEFSRFFVVKSVDKRMSVKQKKVNMVKIESNLHFFFFQKIQRYDHFKKYQKGSFFPSENPRWHG